MTHAQHGQHGHHGDLARSLAEAESEEGSVIVPPTTTAC